MVKHIASRAAGMRLFLIVGVLLLPIIVLGTFMLQSLQLEKQVLQGELNGVAFHRLVMPVMISAMNSRIASEAVQNLQSDGKQLAAELGVTEKYAKLLEKLNTKRPEFDQLIKSAKSLLTDTADTSGLVLDSEIESYHLAIASTNHIPAILMRTKELQLNAMHATATFGGKQDLTVKLLLSAGGFSETFMQLQKSMNGARTASSDKSTYISIFKTIDHNAADAEMLVDIAEKDKTGRFILNLQKVAAIGATLPHVMTESYEIWQAATNKLEQKLTTRLQAAVQNMIVMSAVALVTTIIALGFAVSMFRSTLMQLDHFESAKRMADTSRDAAEEMASKLTVINNDMAKLNRDLETNMRQLTEAQAEIVRKTKFANLGQLTATVAHELRNPLGAVRTSAFLLERKLKGKGLGVESQLLRINNGITRCDDTITQLLDFSRSKQINATMVEIDQWLVGVVEEEARKLPTNINIACALGLENYQMPIDKSRMERAIMNLIANASEAMVGKGEGSISNVTANPTITIETKLSGAFFEIEIADNGPGISAENLLKIREPMFTTKNFGTGLGIPAVEQILEQHGGILDIQSTIGQGAKFTIRLPIEQNLEEVA